MTEKLYYKDAYIKEFTARVLSVQPAEGGFTVVLDRTAFFPEEGGQSADTGRIGLARVLDVLEKDGEVYHLTDACPEQGEVSCSIDFDARFEKMQCHSAEHILCGIIHRLYGLNNVGFHLGDDEVTFDVDGVLTAEELDGVEDLANEAVFSNMSVSAFFPTAEELLNYEYRAKSDLTENIRLVKIGDVDICACCAPHVAATGEIGIIKILDFMKHRGGTRIRMAAGRRAVRDYRARYENIKRISAILSAPQLKTADTLEAYAHECDRTAAALKQARLRIAELEAEKIHSADGSAVFYLPDFTIPELIAFSNVARKKVSGITVALSGNEGDYKYVISSDTVNLRAASAEINSALSGRGGGRREMIQGSFGCGLDDIEKYFKA